MECGRAYRAGVNVIANGIVQVYGSEAKAKISARASVHLRLCLTTSQTIPINKNGLSNVFKANLRLRRIICKKSLHA